MIVHQGESSPLSPPPPTPATHSPIMHSRLCGRKRSRQVSVAGSLSGSDAESVRSMRKLKKVKYTR